MKGKIKGFVLAVGALFLIGVAPAYSEVKHNDDASLLMQIGPYAILSNFFQIYNCVKLENVV